MESTIALAFFVSDMLSSGNQKRGGSFGQVAGFGSANAPKRFERLNKAKFLSQYVFE